MTDQDPDATPRPPAERPTRPADTDELHAAYAAHVADDEAAQADPTAPAAATPPDAEQPEQAPEGPVDADGDPLSVARRERDEYLDALRRKQAEFENFRKRMMRDGASQRITGHAEVAERMLDVLDDFDRTLQAAGDVDPGFLKGVQLVQEKLARVLADFGLARIDDTGIAFDPNRHEAVQQVPTDEDLEEPIVDQVLRPGYELGGRTLRAAMVAVRQ